MTTYACVRRELSCVVFALFVSCGLLSAQKPPQFTIAETGVLPGFQASQGTAISNSGIVVGFSTSPGFSFSKSGTSGAASKGWIYTQGVLTDLGDSGQAVTIPVGVNDSGQVVGLIADPSGNTPTTEFFYRNGRFMNPAGFPALVAVPYSINDAGQVSETLNPGKNGQVASFSNGLTESPLTPSQGAMMAWGNGINAFGQVAGASSDGSTLVPVVWINGQPRTFALPTGFTQGMAFGINNSSQAAGFVLSPGSNTHAAFFNNGTAVDLGVLADMQASIALGVNDSGWVVGFSSTSRIDTSGLDSGLDALAAFSSPALTTHAFLWINGAIYDLNTLLTNGSGWVLSYAAGINNSGQIVGTGFHDGYQTAFVLTLDNATARPKISHIAGGWMGLPTISSDGWFSISGKNFTTSSQPAFAGVSSAYSTNVAQTCVQVGNTRAQLNFVSATQINALAPSLPAGQPVPISVISNCGTPAESASMVVDAVVVAPPPGFLYWMQTADGESPVVAVEVANGALVGPPGMLPGVPLVPARQGDLVTIYYAGMGGASPSSVTIGGEFAAVIDLNVTSANPSLSQINVIVPHGLTPGNQPIVVTMNGVASAPGAFLTVGL